MLKQDKRKEFMGSAASPIALDLLNSLLDAYKYNRCVYKNTNGNLYLYGTAHPDIIKELNKQRIPLFKGLK